MLEIYLICLLITAASLLAGRALLVVLGWRSSAWLAGATGFAALVVVAPFVVRLPGRATTAAIVLVALLLGAAAVVYRARRPGGSRSWRGSGWPIGIAAALIVVALASVPFALNDQVGILGEGIYTNDHAAQLYWAQWLQSGFGPEPSAVQFGYPIGPQALTAIFAEATGIDLVAAFNGLLLAIPALTALAALGALAELPPARRLAVAAISALPYLAASFLAQSAFKETAMALFVLAFAVCIGALSGLARDRPDAPPRTAVAGVILILAAASVFTFSIPGLAWFAIALPLWLVLEELAGRSPIDYREVGAAVGRHRGLVAVAGVVLVAVAVFAIGPASNFVEKIGDVQQSQGRLGSPIFPGETFGLWPEGDFRIVRGEVSGALVVSAFGALAALYGAWVLVRRRQFGILATLIAGAIVYVGARLVAEIHVEAKALIAIAPLVLLVGLRALLTPGDDRWRPARYALGAVLALGALASTLVALRAAPVGYDNRAAGLEQLAERIEGESVVFLGVDRFSGYRLRDTLMRAPAGFVPEEIAWREDKPWSQGEAVDFDTLESGKLDKFNYAITTSAAYASTPPPNFERVADAGGYVLWDRDGETPRSRILDGERDDEGAYVGAVLDCDSNAGKRLRERGGTAVIVDEPFVSRSGTWVGPEYEPAAGGQERGFEAGEGVRIGGDLPPGLSGGRYELSLQYQSQVPLTVIYDGEEVGRLPASLDGMYFDGAGRGAFWPVGEIELDPPASVMVVPEEPNGLQDALGVPRRIWLGDLAVTPVGEPRTVALAKACGEFVDHFTLDRRGGKS
jgi:hypothetical protein